MRFCLPRDLSDSFPLVMASLRFESKVLISRFIFDLPAISLLLLFGEFDVQILN